MARLCCLFFVLVAAMTNIVAAKESQLTNTARKAGFLQVRRSRSSTHLDPCTTFLCRLHLHRAQTGCIGPIGPPRKIGKFCAFFAFVRSMEKMAWDGPKWGREDFFLLIQTLGRTDSDFEILYFLFMCCTPKFEISRSQNSGFPFEDRSQIRAGNSDA